MDMIHKDLERKNAEIEAFKQGMEREPSPAPVPNRRTSILPAELDDDKQMAAKEASARKAMLEELMAKHSQAIMEFDDTIDW